MTGQTRVWLIVFLVGGIVQMIATDRELARVEFVIYLLAMAALGTHLSHGIKSAFQTLGLSHPRYTPLVEKAAFVVALFASARTGAVFMPVDTALRDRELTGYLTRVTPRLVIAPAGRAAGTSPIDEPDAGAGTLKIRKQSLLRM